MAHDFSMHSGERQTAPSYGEIRADHRARYEWADKLIPTGAAGLDIFCGNGYGAWLLGERHTVLGIDGSPEAIAFAERHYTRPSVRFNCAEWPFRGDLKKLPPLNFVVSLESIEHVSDGARFMDAIVATLCPGGQLIFSTPNEEFLPHAKMRNHFHHRHYTIEQSRRLAESRGLTIESWCGQDAYVMDEGRPVGVLAPEQMGLKPETPGQFVVFACRLP